MLAQSMPHPGRVHAFNPYASNPVFPWVWVAGGVVVAGGVGVLTYRHYKKRDEEAVKVAQQQQALDEADGEEIIVEPEGSPFVDGAPPIDTGRPGIHSGTVQGGLTKAGPAAKATSKTVSPFLIPAMYAVPQQQEPPPMLVDYGGPFGTGEGKAAGGGDVDPWTPGPGKGAASLQLPHPLTSNGWYHVASFRGPLGRVYAIYMEQGAKGFRWAIAGIGPAAGAKSSNWKVTGRAALKQAMTRLINYEGWSWAKKKGGVIYLNEGFLGVPDAWHDDAFVRCSASGVCDIPGSAGAGEGGGK